MNVMLTSCGLETECIARAFLAMLPKPPADIRALYIPTAANDPDAIEVLPKCLNDLLKIGIARENITVYDLYDAPKTPLADFYDVIYFCGGSTPYLLRRIRERGFEKPLAEYIACDGVVLGVSAGSRIFADDLPGNLGLLSCGLDVHCADDSCIRPGSYPVEREERIRLGNRQAILVKEDSLTVIE